MSSGIILKKREKMNHKKQETPGRKEKKAVQKAIKKAKGSKKDSFTAQQAIAFERMFPNGICRVKENYYTKTLQFEDISYRLAGTEKKLDLFDDWRGFLNFFDSSVNVEMSFVNLETDTENFDRMVRMTVKRDGFDDIRSEYMDMLKDQFAKGNNGLTKKKYLTFGISANSMKEAVPRLSKIEADILSNFRRIGVRVKSLNGKERLKVFHDIFHMGEKDRFLFDWKDLARSGLTPKDFIAPTSFQFPGRTFQMGSLYGAMNYLLLSASEMSDEFLKELLDMESMGIVSFHIQSVDHTTAIKEIKHKLTELDRSKIEEQRKAVLIGYDIDILPSDLSVYGTDAKFFLNELQSENERMFIVTILIMVTGKSEMELNNHILQAQSIVQKYNCNLRRLDFRQEQGLMSCIPLGEDQIKINRRLTTNSTAIFIPFMTQELFQTGPQALYYGVNALTNNMIMADRKLLNNPNGLILGTPGSGKSFAAKREITNVVLVTDDDVIITDPECEYQALVKKMNGQVINISSTSDQHINPMDINDNYSDGDIPVALKADFILSLCELILADTQREKLRPKEKTLIDRCVRKIYERYYENPIPERMPILEDLYLELQRQEEKEAQDLAVSLEIYVKGSLNLFNHRTDVDIENRLVCYDIHNIGNNLKKISMLIIQDQVWGRVTANRNKGKFTRYFVDEFHLLLREEQTAAYSVEIWKRFRKWGGIPTGITQNIQDLMASKEIENIFTNSDFIYMLNQRGEDKAILSRHLNISEDQQKYVTNVKAGEGLIFYGDVILPFIDHFPKNLELYRIMSTKLSENAQK